MKEEAQALTEEGLAIARAGGDDGLAGWALHNLGFLLTLKGDYSGARSVLDESVELCRQVGDRVGEGMSLRDLGHIARLDGDYHRADELYMKSLSLLRVVGHRTNIVWTLQGIGYLARQMRDINRARSALRESSIVGEQVVQHFRIHSVSDWALGNLERSVGNYDEAALHLRAALAELERNLVHPGITWQTRYYVHSMATIYLQSGARDVGVRLAAFVADDYRDPVNNLREDIADHERALQEARVALGDDAFAVAWAAGKAMTIDVAVALALSKSTDHGTVLS